MLLSRNKSQIYPQQLRSTLLNSSIYADEDQAPANGNSLPPTEDSFDIFPPKQQRHLMPSQAENQAFRLPAPPKIKDHASQLLPQQPTSSFAHLALALPVPMLEPFMGQNPREGLSNAVIFEFDRLTRESSHLKDEFIRTKAEQTPIELDYNPKKSRLKKNYRDAEEESKRAENNAASRRSRHKKKLQVQLMKLSLTFDRDENRTLFGQEKWLSDVISELEGRLISQGYDLNAIKNLRSRCGLK